QKEVVSIGADAEKYKQEIQAQAQKSVIEIEAEAKKTAVENEAQASKFRIEQVAAATLVQQLNEAKGTQSIGLAEAEAEKAKQLASVTAQTTLAREVGENKEYQQYLITIEQIKAYRDVGIEQAKNIGNAKIEILANSGNIESGLNRVTDLFTSKGAAALNGLFTGLEQTAAGKSLISKLADQPEKE
ncbi:MAG: hypothetical protein LBP92_14580, partial [Deltaproteobacteria bacterium]|nr:hypothetical protein [Deltaproteobacteria bacterium]